MPGRASTAAAEHDGGRGGSEPARAATSSSSNNNSQHPKGLSVTELDTYAQWAWLSGRVGEAVDLYLDLARLHRRAPHVHFKLGFLYLLLQDPQSAVRHFTLEIERYGAEVFDVAGEPRPQQPQVPSRATTTASPTSRSPPLSGQAINPMQQRAFLFCTYAGRSEAFEALRDRGKADADLLFLTNRGANAKSSLLAMGSLYFRFGMHQRADDCFDKCAAADAEDPEYLIEHAELRLAQRRYASAVGMFAKCRSMCSTGSPLYHRALIGEGTALMRQDLLQDAVILLLQAMNTLRNAIRNGQSVAQKNVEMHPSTTEPYLVELVHLYHQATNVYGGLCMMKGELKAALDTYYSVLHHASPFTDIAPFRLPTMCIVPGTKDKCGVIVDSTKLSTKNLEELVRHLNEVEWRYGPDPCTFFHRANVKRAMGELEGFVHDLSLVESMDPEFLKSYLHRDCFGDFLDVETISWIPTRFIDAIHEALERSDYFIPSPHPISQGNDTSSNLLKSKGTGQTNTSKVPSFSEHAILTYFRERVKGSCMLDVYAHVFQLDVCRRLPETRRQPGRESIHDLSPWEGVVLDVTCNIPSKKSERTLQETLEEILARHNKHPCVHMLAGMIELDMFNASAAFLHFTEAITMIDRSGSSTEWKSSSLSVRWQHNVLQRVKFYCLIWRSISSRIKIEMEKAVEDLNLAAAIPLSDKSTGGDDPFLLVQRIIILLLNGHLKSAYKLIRLLKRRLRLAKKNKSISAQSTGSDKMDVIDMFGSAGFNTFHLLPIVVQHDSRQIFLSRSVDMNTDQNDEAFDQTDRDEEVKEEQEEEETAISIVKYALTKKAASQGEVLDKFFESGILKLSGTGGISQVIPFFQAILSMDEGYLPPTNFASLEIFKCKEQEIMEEKLFNCFVRLGKRSKWLQKKVKWKYEALIDANLAHAYLPTDMETLWHRARLLQDQRNYVAAINDLTDCLHLMTLHFSWERGKTDRAVFSNETKKTQWLQLLLERGSLEMELGNWDKAIDDLSVVIMQCGKTNKLLELGAYEARSTCLVRLRRYGHAIQDLQHLLAITKPDSKKKIKALDTRKVEDLVLNCLIVGNLYCQLALDKMKGSAGITQNSTTFTPAAIKQLRTKHVNLGFISKATEYYDEAESMAPDHFLVHFFRGRMFSIAGQSQKATRCISDCLRRHPMFLPAMFLRGCVYAQENLFVLALADFYRVRHRVATYPHLHSCIGYCHYARGSMIKAVEALTEAIIQYPDDAEAYYMRGCALQEMMVLENAARDFESVAKLNPEHYRAYYQQAVCKLLLERYDAAFEDTSRVVRLQPEWKDAWILHGYACFCAEKYTRAMSAYDTALTLTDSKMDSKCSFIQQSSLLLMFRAFAFIQSGEHKSALNDLDLALKKDNENYVAFLAKAYCQSKLGDKPKAALVLAHCLPQCRLLSLLPADLLGAESAIGQTQLPSDNFSASPTKSSGLANGSIQYADPHSLFVARKILREKEPQDLLQSFQVAIQHDKQTLALQDRRSGFVDTEMQKNVGKLTSRMSKRFSSASACINADAMAAKARSRQVRCGKFLRAIKKLNFQYRVLKALEQSSHSKYKKNQRLARSIIDVLQPVNKIHWPKGSLSTKLLVWGYNCLGIQQVHQHRIDDALMAFTLAIQANASNPVTYFNRGNVYLYLEVCPSAISGFQDALETSERYYRAYNNMGVAYFKMRRLDEAQDAFSTGLHHASNEKQKAILLYNLGVVFQALDKTDEALEFYQQAIGLDASRTEFFNNRSAILHQQMKYAVALDDYNRALRLQQEHTAHGMHGSVGEHEEAPRRGIEARLNRAQLFIAMGNCTLAIRDLRVALTSMDTANKTLPRQDHDGHAQQARTFATGVVSTFHTTDAVHASQLLSFCQKWRDALRIAVKDFLFGIDAFPFIAQYQLLAFFNEHLSQPQHAVAETEPVVTPLPIFDASFFNYEQAFRHWDVSDTDTKENENDDEETCEIVRQAKHRLWSCAFKTDLVEAMRFSRAGDSEAASRFLLRAHYKTTLDSHDEYLLIMWRVQIITSDSRFGYEKAINILQEFLDERRTTHEYSVDDEGDDRTDGGGRTRKRAQMPVDLDADENDDDSGARVGWISQRRVIRADFYSVLGSLYQLEGNVNNARRCFQLALRLFNHHAIALINYLQLSIVQGEYEAALDSILKLLNLTLVQSRPSEHGRKPIADHESRGLLQADRSISTMLPWTIAAFQDGEMARLGNQMILCLKEYRSMLSSQIQSHTTHIFKKQGSLARLVQDIKSYISLCPASQSEIANERQVIASLSELDVALDDLQHRIVAAPTDFVDEVHFNKFYAAFHNRFAELCDVVVNSLPQDKRNLEQNVEQMSNEQAAQGTAFEISGLVEKEQTIEGFLASITKNGECNKKRKSSSRRVASTPRGSVVGMSESVLNEDRESTPQRWNTQGLKRGLVGSIGESSPTSTLT